MRKIAREWIEKYPSIARLHEAIAGPRRLGSEGSVETYIVGIRHFSKFLKFENDPETAILKMRNGEVDAAAKVDQFIDFMLVKSSHKTVRLYLFGVKKWFGLNGVQVDWDKIEFPTSTETSESDRAPSKEEIKTLLNHAKSARDRAAILVLSSSGLRIGTLLSLKVGDVSFDYPDVARIKVERKRGRKFSKRGGKEGRVFFTWITPEARKALTEYFEERKRTGETLTVESPLVGDAWNHGTFSEVQDFQRSWYRLLERSGLAKKPNKWHELHLHVLRKYFRSNCIGVDPSYREHWMGHKGGYLDESYFRAEEPRHLEEYRKAIPHLTVYATPIEEKQLRSRMLLDFARLQGYNGEEIKRLGDVLARSKDVDEAIQEFRRLKEDSEDKAATAHNGNGKYVVARGEGELIQRLHSGWKLVQPLNHEKYLLQHS